MTSSRSFIAKAAAAALVVAAAGTATVAQARDHVYFSIGANVAPGVVVNASNAPYYYAPRYYAAPAPVYYDYTPAPVYYEPAPVVWGPYPVVYSGVRYYWSPVHHRHYYYRNGQRHWR